MGIFKTGVRKPFAFLPAIAWAVGIDAIDLFPNVINFVLQFFGGVGLALDVFFDVVQTVIAMMIFDDPAFVITNVDFILPPGFDIFPSYTAKVIMYEMGLVK
mgnify:CR=1 FL=1